MSSQHMTESLSPILVHILLDGSHAWEESASSFTAASNLLGRFKQQPEVTDLENLKFSNQNHTFVQHCLHGGLSCSHAATATQRLRSLFRISPEFHLSRFGQSEVSTGSQVGVFFLSRHNLLFRPQIPTRKQSYAQVTHNEGRAGVRATF